MLRELKAFSGGVVHADYKAKTDMKTGMAVVIDEGSGQVQFPTAATASELYFVNKERIPTGTNAARTDISDYDDEYVTVKAGEYCKVKSYREDAIIATDAKGSTAPTKGKVLAAGTDGKLIDAATTIASKYLYIGDIVDNGHTLMQIKILDTPIKNA